MGKNIDKNTDYRNSPVAWFCVLEEARQKNDFERAALAKRELQRLGVQIRYRKKRTTQDANDGR